MSQVYLAKFLKKRRLEIKETAQNIAGLSGISEEYLSRIENGHRTNVGFDTLQKLAKSLRFSIKFECEQEVRVS